MKCTKRGMTVVKFFPCEPMGGLGFIRRMAGPFANVKFLASAGIHFPNLAEYLDCPGVLCCASGFMCKDIHLQTEDWDDVTERCARVTAIADKRLNK
jgi:2-dehydro-3-deoxyphosphogluconate aldolase/(4S)-4-hydroxy-2-oxoglutarate aldolase